MKYTFNKSDYKRLLGLTLHTDEELKDYIIKHYNSPNSIRMTDEEITFHTKRIVTPEESKIDKLYQLFNDGEIDNAIELAFEILKYSPNDITSNRILSYSFFEKNDLDMAMKYALIALRFDLEDPSCLTLLGMAMLLKNDLNTAMTYWNEVYHSNEINSLEIIGTRLLSEGYYEIGVCFLEKVLKIDPNNSDVLRYLSQIYFANNEIEKSLTYVRRSLNEYTDDQISELMSDLMLELKISGDS